MRRGERVLDLGCGAGRFVAALREAGADAVGSSSPRPRSSGRGATSPGADLRLLEPDGSLPLGHGEVDLVWCSEVLEHVPDTAALLTEVRRVLKRGGRLLVTVPDHGRLRRTLIALARHEVHYDPLGQHVRFYTRRSLARTLQATGFTEIRIEPLGGLPLLRDALVARALRA